MIFNALEYLEKSARDFPERTAVIEEEIRCTYAELAAQARRVGSALAEMDVRGCPVGVYMEKGVDALRAFMGALYAGGFYSMLNPELPAARLQTIQGVLGAKVIVTRPELAEDAAALFPGARIARIDELAACDEDAAMLADIRRRAIDAEIGRASCRERV